MSVRLNHEAFETYETTNERKGNVMLTNNNDKPLQTGFFSLGLRSLGLGDPCAGE